MFYIINLHKFQATIIVKGKGTIQNEALKINYGIVEAVGAVNL